MKRSLAALLLACMTSTAQAGPSRIPVVTSTIGFPLDGSRLPAGAPITIEGGARSTATIARVEVSTDGGATWAPANGTAQWSFPWVPPQSGLVQLRTRAFDAEGGYEIPGPGVWVGVGLADPPACPCTIWPFGTVPPISNDGAGIPLEVGVRFRSDLDGVIESVRFYKTWQFAGHHTANLWTTEGKLLGTAEFDTSGVNGWHDVPFATPIPIQRDSFYVASVFMPRSHYALAPAYFYQRSVDQPPLHAPANHTGARNGVYSYGTVSSFPDSEFNESNYWVDVRFNTGQGADVTSPYLTAIAPLNGACAASVSGEIRATFSEPIDPTSLTDSSFVLVGPSGDPVPAALAYSVVTRTATLTPFPLVYGAAYTARLTTAVRDPAGNPLLETSSWSFRCEPAPPPPPDDGPGGPILVLVSTANPMTRYVPEVLRAEGLNAFRVCELAALDEGVLAAHEVAILGEAPLDSAQAAMLEAWVAQGGNLIALRPDARLAGLSGLARSSGTIVDQYLRVDTGSSPGAGIVGEPIQFHGPADRYDLVPGGGARAVAWLYANATQPTLHPAVTLRSYGASGGEVAVFTYDLARSVTRTRQGNPAWAGQERDGITPYRPDDLFYGAADFDPHPDYVDFAKLAIPQADEQQRLLANLVLVMMADRAPLPRFWYFPSGEKAAIVMTGDDHGTNGTARRFDEFIAHSAPDCSVDDWECIRGTSYLYSGPPFTDAQLQFYQAHGFDFAVHLFAGCLDGTQAQMAQHFDQDLELFGATYPSALPPNSNRTHCTQWLGYASEAELEAERGIRFDTNYYFFPGEWVRNTPGMFTGSGMPMRMAREDGTVIDCYQGATIFTDDTFTSIPHNVDVVLDHAVGPEGWYGAFVCNVHMDIDSDHVADDIIASAKAHDVPVVSARQMLTWIDGRNGSTFEDLHWSAGTLTFAVNAAGGARNLQTLLPLVAFGDTLRALLRGGAPIAFAAEVVKGIACARFDSPAGAYEAQYRDRPVGAPGSGALHFALGPIAPNPAVGAVRFGFDLPAATVAQLSIYGVRGNLVRTLLRETRPAGHTGFVWDRHDRFGQDVPSGIYVARLEAAGRVATRRLVLLR